MPKLSVITINYNDANGLEKTIKSVISQSVTDFEFVIIDGASTDDSADVIKKYEDQIDFWGSEKDNGIYDAQNKGISKATGDYLLFLNSGDSFYDNYVVLSFYEHIKNKSKKLIYGNSNIINADGSSSILVPSEKLDLNFWYANTLNHQAVFAHKMLFEKYKNFNSGLKYASDFEWLLKVFIAEPDEFKHMNLIVCNYDNTGLTSKEEFHPLIIEERNKVMLGLLSKEQFSEMKSAYFKGLTFRRRMKLMMLERPILKAILKPFYRIYQFLVK